MSSKIGVDITIIDNIESISGEEIVTLSIVEGIYEARRSNDFVFFAKESVKQQLDFKYKGLQIIGIKQGRNKFYKRFLPRYIKKNNIKAFYYPHCSTDLNLNIPAVVIATVHGLYSKDIPKRAIRQVVKKIRQADIIIAVSHFVKDELSRMKVDSDKIVVINNSLFDIRSGIDIVYKKKYILSVNSDIPNKNIMATVKAFCRIKDDIDHDLVIIGRINEKGKVYKYIKKHELAKRIIITGHMNRDTLFGYYNNADLYISTSKYEGFGLTPLEALASSAKVLCTMTPSLKVNDVIKPDGVITDPDDFSGIAKSIVKILKNPADENFLSNRADMVKEFFGKDKMIEKYLKVFDNFIF